MAVDVKVICCIGAGYVGGPTMAVIADKCPHIEVNVVDLNKNRIDLWNNSDLSKLPIFEPGLKEVIKRCRGRNLHFSSLIEENIKRADMIFISVNTPIKTKGIGAGKASDLKWVEASARQISKFAKKETIVVEKSTLPVRTADTIQQILKESELNNKNKKFSVLSNPEFLAEGNAIKDLENPDRVLIGGVDEESINALKKIYLNWVDEEKILTTNLWSSELSKLVANAFLAQRISSINSISALCETTGADIKEVSLAIGMDSRLGSKFLAAGPGFGGSCFKKDILNLVYISEYYGLKEVASYWEQVVAINSWQNKRISKIILAKLFGTLAKKKIGILGFSFKANTNDTRESPAIRICKDLIEEGGSLYIYDPRVSLEQIESDLGLKNNYQGNLTGDLGNWSYCKKIIDTFEGADAVLVLTEWDQFKDLNWENLSKLMRHPSWVFDTRGIVDTVEAKSCGLNVWQVGNGE